MKVGASGKWLKPRPSQGGPFIAVSLILCSMLFNCVSNKFSSVKVIELPPRFGKEML